MGVDSVFEMYTLMWGWQQYGVLWKIMTDTGLAFIPFFGLIFNSILQTVQSQDPGDASTASLKGVEIQFISMLVLIVVAVQPTVSVSLEEVEYVKICFQDSKEPNKTFKMNNDKSKDKHETAYDRFSMQGFEKVKIPAWWYAVLSFSNGLVRAGQEAMPCIKDLRSDVSNLNSHMLDSPPLLAALKEFNKKCYEPVKSRHENNVRLDNFADFERPIIERTKELYKGYDTAWMGSYTFLKIPRYYAYVAVHDFPHSGFKYPISCKTLWEQDTFGLRDWLIITIRRSNPERFAKTKEAIDDYIDDNSGFFAGGDLTSDEKQELTLYFLLKSNLGANLAYQSTNDAITTDGLTSGAVSIYNSAALWGGLQVQKIKHYTMIDVLITALPVIGSLLLLCLYVFLPFGLVFSSYSLKFIMIASVGIFSVKFYFYLWHIAWWLDQNLVQLLTLELLSMSMTQTDILNIVSGTMYVIFPMLWTVIVAWAGIQLDRHLGATTQLAGEMATAGGTGAANYVISKGQQGTGMLMQAGYNKLAGKKSDAERIEEQVAKRYEEKLNKEREEKEQMQERMETAEDEINRLRLEKEQKDQVIHNKDNEIYRLQAEASSGSYSDDDFYYPITDSSDSSGDDE